MGARGELADAAAGRRDPATDDSANSMVVGESLCEVS